MGASTSEVLSDDAVRTLQWYAWLGASFFAFAALEIQAWRSKGKHSTLSYVLRLHSRKSVAHRAGVFLFFAWFTYHILFGEKWS